LAANQCLACRDGRRRHPSRQAFLEKEFPVAAIPGQQAVRKYHHDMRAMHHDIFSMHAQWHADNPPPAYPADYPLAPDASWGTDKPFGEAFLMMHHEMLYHPMEPDGQAMSPPGFFTWYEAQEYDYPDPWPWDPSTPIPAAMAFAPELNKDLPPLPVPEMLAVLHQIQQGSNPLLRNPDTPFQLGRYFTAAGAGEGEPVEPCTGFRKLAEFKNLNQLGCCLARPHFEWHQTIGGVMTRFDWAPADPIFYFGVHWHIEQVYQEYRQLQGLG
jgi:hypothetical protein